MSHWTWATGPDGSGAPDMEAVCGAEHTIALLLALSRNLKTVCRQAAEGGMPYPYPAQWRTQREIEGKQLLLLGLGETGRHIVRKAKGLGLKIWCYSPRISSREAEQAGAQKAENLALALGGADYISLHPSGRDSVLPQVGTEHFSAMKQGSFFLCTSPTVQVDEKALTQALQDKRLSGAGMALPARMSLPADSPLFHMENVILIPGCMGAAGESGTGGAA